MLHSNYLDCLPLLSLMASNKSRYKFSAIIGIRFEIYSIHKLVFTNIYLIPQLLRAKDKLETRP